jgi:predicted amidophosphoribosyltransferase
VGDYLDKLLETAAGFPGCRACMYLETGSAALCSRCARRTLEPLSPVDERCGICDQPYFPGKGECRNPLCNAGWRMFEWNYAIAMRTTPLKNAIAMYKYGGERRWATIFGRIVAGFIEEHATTMSTFDIIAATPTYVGPGGRSFDHTLDVLAVANLETGGRWPFDIDGLPVIVQTTATERMARIGTYAARKEHAQTTLRAALSVPDPTRTTGRSILVYDDLFTNGLVLNEVARALKEDGGADQVCGLSLAREPWNRGVE